MFIYQFLIRNVSELFLDGLKGQGALSPLLDLGLRGNVRKY